MAGEYADKMLDDVKAAEQAELNDNEKTYGGMIEQSDQHYQGLIDASKDWADKQTELQNQQTDFAIKEIQQQQEQTKKDYIKEQSGAYVDWQKQSDPYGVNAEQMASQGLTNSGYSETSQVAMYNTYQNRVAAARESYDRAVLNYNNSITEARLQNNSILAEIAYTALQQQLELSLQGFQYKNQLILDQAEKKMAIKTNYWNKYQDTLNQINTQEALELEREKWEYEKGLLGGNTVIQKTGSASKEQDKAKDTVKEKAAIKKQEYTPVTEKKTSGSNSSSVGNYESAVALLNRNAIKGDGGLMTESEWKKRKSAGSNRAAAQYDSYAEYATAFVRWRIENPTG